MEGEDKMNKQKPQMICALKTEQKGGMLRGRAEERKTTQVVSFQNDRNWYL